MLEYRRPVSFIFIKSLFRIPLAKPGVCVFRFVEIKYHCHMRYISFDYLNYIYSIKFIIQITSFLDRNDVIINYLLSILIMAKTRNSVIRPIAFFSALFAYTRI